MLCFAAGLLADGAVTWWVWQEEDLALARARVVWGEIIDAEGEEGSGYFAVVCRFVDDDGLPRVGEFPLATLGSNPIASERVRRRQFGVPIRLSFDPRSAGSQLADGLRPGARRTPRRVVPGDAPRPGALPAVRRVRQGRLAHPGGRRASLQAPADARPRVRLHADGRRVLVDGAHGAVGGAYHRERRGVSTLANGTSIGWFRGVSPYCSVVDST